MKKNIIKPAAIIMAVVMAAAVIAFIATDKSKPGKLPTITESTVYSYEGSAYTAKASVSGANGEVYLPTEEDGLYYTATLNNEINFWFYRDGAFTPASYEKKTVKVNIYATYESIPVTITYVNGQKSTYGYGVFTAEMDKNVDIYDFAFVAITRAPADYGASSGYLLLADFNKADFYKAEKTYSEIYKFNLNQTNFSTSVSNNTRLIDRNGGFKQSWTMITDEFLKNIGSAGYYMSSRYYSEAECGKRTDIMVYSSAYRPKIVAKDIVGDWFVYNSNGMFYLKKTDNGFKVVRSKDGETSDLTKFEGDYFTDYIRCEQYVLNKKTGVITDMLGGSTIAVDGVDTSAASVFRLNNAMTKAVIAFPGKTNTNGTVIQSVVYCTLDGSKEAEIYSEPLLYSESASFIWLDNDRVMSVRALDGTGASCGSIIYTY